MDDVTTVTDLKKIVENFVQERDWAQFHNPKNLSMALAGEAAELMEHFQWLNHDEAWEYLKKDEFSTAVKEELADVIIYAFAFANRNGIDIDSIIQDKMKKNRIKYPADQFKGRF